MAINKTINKRTNTHGAMRNCIEYVLRQDKTNELFTCVTGPYCHDEINYDLVYRTFLEEKKMWDKDSGRMYAHNIISWHKDEQITPEQALEFGQVKDSFVADCAMSVLKALENCISKEKFIEKMKQFGWNVNWTEKRKHITFQNQDGKKVRDSNLSKTFHLDISKEGLENEFNGNREKSRVAADRDSRADEELRNYYRELDAAIKDARGIADQTQSGEGYSRTEFRESESVHANTEKADPDTGRGETDDLIRQAEIARRSSEINRRNSASDNRTVRNAEAESIASAEQRRSEKQKWLNEQERARATRRRNKRRSGPEL